MAGRGPAPGHNPNVKPADQRRHRIKPAPLTMLKADGKVYGPELPDSFDWPDATREWWQIWRTSAQASKLADTDWSFLRDTAVLHAEFWQGNLTVAAELRLRVSKFGATMEDRARLKFAIGEPDTVAPPPTRLRTKANNQRSRLLKAVNE